MDEVKVYVPHADSSWVRATVLKCISKTKYLVIIDGIDDNHERGEAQRDSNSIPIEIDMQCSKYEFLNKMESLPLQNLGIPPEGVSDMTTLNHLHEPGILFNLRKRFFSNAPYTYTGDIVIAVNPYRWLDLYDDNLAEKYIQIKPSNRNSLPPHVYSTSAIAYSGLCTDFKSQSILVSGESGAGKTETVKILMGHLANLAQLRSAPFRKSNGIMKRSSMMHLTKDLDTLESDDETIKKIIESNPLLESFGNAKTSRNDNSSRFGKFTQLQYNKYYAMVGSKCTTYLLEKSRIVSHSKGERGFHIFYQLLAAPETEKSKFGLSFQTASNFGYLTADGFESSAIIEGKTDKFRYEMTCKALDIIGVSQEQRYLLFSALAGIIQIGQIKFIPVPDDEESCAIDNIDDLKICSCLLGLDSYELEKVLRFRTVKIRGEVIESPARWNVASEIRDALAKTLYSLLFDWLVRKINQSTSCSEGFNSKERKSFKDPPSIALLDIFGFESFIMNRFEQLCINYANEKLQQKFTQDIFKTVQIEYEAENIPWSTVDFTDNSEVLKLIESTTGVLAILNEECMLGKGSDLRFTSKLTSMHQDNPHLVMDRLNHLSFGVKHYAGLVHYNAKGFLEKNKDSICEDSLSILSYSASSVIREVFSSIPITPTVPAQGKLQRSKSSAALSTLAYKFKTSLNELMEVKEKHME